MHISSKMRIRSL